MYYQQTKNAIFASQVIQKKEDIERQSDKEIVVMTCDEKSGANAKESKELDETMSQEEEQTQQASVLVMEVEEAKEEEC